MVRPLERLLNEKRHLVLDGAMGTELQRRGVDTGLPLWSANALVVHPEVVSQIHSEYIASGVDIITTNTFRTTRRSFRRANLPDRSKQLTVTAVDLARKARDASGKQEILVAGSMAPLEDCYRPDLVPSDRDLRDEHAELAERLADERVDFILLETMNTVREAYAACAAAVAVEKEVVVSFICNRDGCVFSGESLQDAVNAVSELHPTAFSINCVSPRHIQSAIRNLRSATTRAFAVYANVGLPENEERGWEFTRDISEDEYAVHARDWRHMGASIIGGCCGTTPEYIRAVKRALAGRAEVA
jgi:S-methylmethionine-dependent homocysteine/selenocysteine methylase